jgi:hypothetical protein
MPLRESLSGNTRPRCRCRCLSCSRADRRSARLQGFEQDLGLTGTQFPTLLSILYVGYILFQ